MKMRKRHWDIIEKRERDRDLITNALGGRGYHIMPYTNPPEIAHNDLHQCSLQEEFIAHILHVYITEIHLFMFTPQMCLVALPYTITMKATPTHSTTPKVRCTLTLKNMVCSSRSHSSRAHILHTHIFSTSRSASTVRSLANQARGSMFLLAQTSVSASH